MKRLIICLRKCLLIAAGFARKLFKKGLQHECVVTDEILFV